MKHVRRAVTVGSLALSIFLISTVGDESESSSPEIHLAVVAE